MKYLFWLMGTLLISTMIVVAQTTEAGSSLKSLVETEQAFSKTAEDKSTREAFLQFIAEDGILFRPTAVQGKQWLSDHPTPPSQKRPLLAWQPVYAFVARAGDVGYTTGPWEFKGDIKDEKPAAYGDFVTVWKKQSDGSWKFVLDLGISHPQSSGPLKLWKLSNKVGAGTVAGNTNPERARNTLLNRDREFASVASSQGFAKTFLTYATNDVRLFRDDSNPFVGKEASARALTSGKGLVTCQPTNGDVSLSGDLGYTYGTYDTLSDDGTKKLIEHGNYLRIWKQQEGQWKIVLDVANPIPPS
jgi:ketosteroid isomerase-like protein